MIGPFLRRQLGNALGNLFGDLFRFFAEIGAQQLVFALLLLLGVVGVFEIGDGKILELGQSDLSKLIGFGRLPYLEQC